MTPIQTCGSHDPSEDTFTFSMCFGDSPALTFEGLTRDQVANMRDCLDCMLWHEQESDYTDVLLDVQMTIAPYVSVLDTEVAATEVLETIRALLLQRVDFTKDSSGILHWPEIEGMITKPLDQ